MDPLSVVASIIAVLQLTNKVIGYLNDVKDASKERARVAVETSNLYSLLTNLRFRLEDEDADTPWFVAIRALAVQNGPLDQFKEALELLQAGMTDGKSQLAQLTEPLVWKFKKHEIERILQSVERLKTLIAVALQMDHFKLSQAIKNDTGLLKTQISTIGTNVDSLRLDHDRAHLDDLQHWLSQTDFPAQQADILRRRREGTGQWFLNTSEFADWLDTSTPKTTLLCTGIPGAGKTMLAAVAVDHLLTKVRNTTVAVAFLYCNYKSRNEQSIEALLAAILQQLLQPNRPHVVKLVAQLYEEHVAQGKRPSVEKLRDTLLAVLAEFSSVYVVIDALDECSADNGTRSQLLDHLREVPRATNLRVLITSRHLPDIVQEFSTTPRVEIRAHDEDVRLFLAGEFHRLPRCIQRDVELQRMVEDKIVSAIDGMFLLARLYVDSLMDKRTKSKVQTTLNSLAGGSHMLETAYKDAVSRLKSQLSGDTALAMRVLTYIVHAESALTTTELCHALAVEEGESFLDLDNLPDIQDIIAVCAGLVAIDEDSDIIRLVHYTTYEYFEATRTDWSPRGQLHITKTCLTYLAFDVFKTGSCSTDPEFKRRSEDYPFLDYAALHWGAHAMSVQEEVFDMACTVLMDSNLVSTMLQAAAVPLRRHDGGTYSHYFPKGRIGLHVTAELGLRDIAEKMLDSHESKAMSWITTIDNKGRTPLYVAAVHGQKAMVELLLSRGANPNVHGGGSDYPLIAAVLARHEESAKLLLDYGADPNAISKALGTALHTAFSEDHQELVRLLVVAGAEIPVAHTYRLSPLHMAAERGWHDVVQSLVDRQDMACLAQVDSRGRSALYGATVYNHTKSAELLLVKGVPANPSEGNKWIPILVAAASGHVDILQLLLRHGADIEVVIGEAGPPLNEAASRGHLEAVRLLLQHGACLDAFNADGSTPLDVAAWNGYEEVVQGLLDHGADINAQNQAGWTSLHKACYEDQLDVVQLLLEKGANTDIMNDKGWTPIATASSCGFIEVVKALLDAGANVFIPDDLGWVPLTIAAENNYMNVVELLLSSIKDFDDISCARGPLLTTLARQGAVKLLKSVRDKYKVDMLMTDLHGRNLLHTAAAQGHFDTFPFLQDLGISNTATDATGDGMLQLAASSGCSETCDIVLKSLPLPKHRDDHWSPLHWACRAGDASTIELLAKAGIAGYCVNIQQSRSTWSPLDILIFHGNESALEELSESTKEVLGPRANEYPPTKCHANYLCDACDHFIMGARFKCLSCVDFDYCFMCKPFYSHLHVDHEWDYIELPTRDEVDDEESPQD